MSSAYVLLSGGNSAATPPGVEVAFLAPGKISSRHVAKVRESHVPGVWFPFKPRSALFPFLLEKKPRGRVRGGLGLQGFCKVPQEFRMVLRKLWVRFPSRHYRHVQSCAGTAVRGALRQGPARNDPKMT